MKDVLRAYAAPIFISLMLASCGGGSGGGSGGGVGLESGTEALILKKFNDSYGVTRFSEPPEKSGSRTWLYIQPDVASWKRGADAGEEDEDTPIETLTPEKEIKLRIGTIYPGSIRYRDRGVADARFVSINTEERALYFGNSEFTTIIVYSERIKNIPTGPHYYEGIISSGLRQKFSESEFKYSEFRMSADFSEGTGNIRGAVENEFPILDGGFTIDLKNGFFKGDNLDLSIGSNKSTAASIYGTFHGDMAKGVTGVFHDNESVPTHVGMLIGRRTDN